MFSVKGMTIMASFDKGKVDVRSSSRILANVGSSWGEGSKFPKHAKNRPFCITGDASFGSSYSETFRLVVEVPTKLNCERRRKLEEFAASVQGNPVYTRERLANAGSCAETRPGL